MDKKQVVLFKQNSDDDDLQAWMYEQGFYIGRHPQSFTDCFSFKDVDEETKARFKGSSQNLSKTVKALLPKEINGKFQNYDKLVEEIIGNEKFQDCASMQKYGQIVSTGIKKAIAFIIVRSHPEIEGYSDLMQVRDNLNATQKTRSAVYRSSHTGEHKEEVIKMVEENYNSQNKTIIDTDWFRCNMRYLMKRAIACRDTEALELMSPVWDRVSNILLIQVNTTVNEPKILPDVI